MNFLRTACSNLADILFVMEGGELQAKKKFIKMFVDEFMLSSEKTRVGVILYQKDRATLKVPLNTNNSKDELVTELALLTEYPPGSSINAGFIGALEIMQNGRLYVSQVTRLRTIYIDVPFSILNIYSDLSFPDLCILTFLVLAISM